MDQNLILQIITMSVVWLLGYIAKKSSFVNNNLIPLQNLVIGIIVAVVQWIITKDFCIAVALSGIVAGGTYDIFHNLGKLKKEIGEI